MKYLITWISLAALAYLIVVSIDPGLWLGSGMAKADITWELEIDDTNWTEVFGYIRFRLGPDQEWEEIEFMCGQQEECEVEYKIGERWYPLFRHEPEEEDDGVS